MIHEYALEPELVASWHDRMQFRFFIGQFGFGTGRVVSRYPKQWRELVWKNFEITFGGIVGEIARKRIEELLVQLIVPEVSRTGLVWDDTLDWLHNAQYEHARRHFHAILSRKNPGGHPDVICGDDVLDGAPARWSAPGSVVVNRTAASMAKCIEPMLGCAAWVVFIDPHFRAFRPENLKPLSEFLKVIAAASATSGVELHAGAGDWAAPWQDFKSTCEKYLPRIIPAGLTLLVRRWENRKGGDKLHNRYILTDVGGVEFGVGLDEGDPGTTDDITLLSADSYRRRLNDYTGSAPRLT